MSIYSYYPLNQEHCPKHCAKFVDNMLSLLDKYANVIINLCIAIVNAMLYKFVCYFRSTRKQLSFSLLQWIKYITMQNVRFFSWVAILFTAITCNF